MKGMLNMLDDMENWLDDAIATETAQIDRLVRSKRVLQKVYAARQEREDVREKIQQLLVEEERAKRSRPWVHNNSTNNTNNNINANSDRVVPLAAYANSASEQQPNSSNNIEKSMKNDEDVSVLLPKQLDDILALAQHTREGKARPTVATTISTTTNMTTNITTIPSRKPSVPSSTVKKPINMAEKLAKYKLMAPSNKKPSSATKNVAAASSSVSSALPQPPQQKPDIQPLAAFANSKHSTHQPPKAVDETVSAILTEIEATKEYLLRAPQFAALHAFEEDIGHLGRFRISTKIRFSTLKNDQTDKLFQSQLQMLHSLPNKSHLYAWQGFSSDCLVSFLTLSSWSTRTKFQHLTNQLRSLMISNHSVPAVSEALQGKLQQNIRHMQLLYQQSVKSGKRVTVIQVKDLILAFAQLQWWQDVLESLPSNNMSMINDEGTLCIDFWRKEIQGTQNIMMNIFDKLEFGLLEYLTGDGEKGKIKSNNNNGLQALENVLLQYAASLQVQVASIVKYQVLSGFARYCLKKGIVIDTYERRLRNVMTYIQYRDHNSHDENGRDDDNYFSANHALARMRTLIQTEMEWIEFLKLIKLIHAIVAHDGTTLSSCVFVRK